MTLVKICGLSRVEDIEAANVCRPDYIGFVFAEKSRRFVTPDQAARLKRHLNPGIRSVGVFVDEEVEKVAGLLRQGVIDLAQLHGHENEFYIRKLKKLTGDSPLIQALRIRTPDDVRRAEESTADLILLDAGAGTGTTFDWSLILDVKRPYFLAGGLDPENVARAIGELHPAGVDVSSGVETEGCKDKEKMTAFMAAVRRTDR